MIAFPLAYVIAFRGGRYKNALLLLVILPFFITYLVRTLSWQTILDDSGWIVSFLKTIGVLGDDGRLLATSTAVVAGITYNYLPFMILPIYAALERIDPRMLEAGYDLYAKRRDVIMRVVVPTATPGIVAGVLLTFIPAAGDFVNAELLGTPQQSMIGNVIQSRYLEITDYPTAAALSFILMSIILVMVLVYARFVGTESLTGADEEALMAARVGHAARGPARPERLAERLRRAGADLPARAGGDHPALLVQRHEEPLQLHLERASRSSTGRTRSSSGTSRTRWSRASRWRR